MGNNGVGNNSVRADGSKVPILDSPCSVASDGSSTNWNGIPRVRRKWIDVVEGKLSYHFRQESVTRSGLDIMLLKLFKKAWRCGNFQVLQQ